MGALVVQLRLLPDDADNRLHRHAVVDRSGVARFESGDEVCLFHVSYFLSYHVILINESLLVCLLSLFSSFIIFLGERFSCQIGSNLHSSADR